MSSTLQWGTTPATPPTATLDPANGLQPIVDALAAAGSGGIIELPAGTFYADPGNPATPLTIPAGAYDMLLKGIGAANTIIGSPILSSTRVRLSDFHCDPPAGSAYGVKIYNGGAFVASCRLDGIIIGDRAQFYFNGPTNGLVLDGVGVFQASNCTFAFCAGSGILCDATGTVPPNDQPNTTLQFDMCSFVGNGIHGIKLMGSCTIAEFRGGNSEQNGRGGDANSCELYAEQMNNLRVSNFDFETNNVINNQMLVTGCNPVLVDNCNFVTGSGKATRAFIAFSTSGLRMLANRTVGYGAVGAIRVSDDCINCHVDPSNILTVTAGAYPWIEDYSR